jgi:hypothetical protein
MSSQGKVTYQNIRDLLNALGFVGTANENGPAVYHHSQAGSLILLPATRGDRFASDADLQSVGQHLIGRGHICDDDFDAFVSKQSIPESAKA